MLKDEFKNEKLKEFMRKQGTKMIRDQFAKYLTELKDREL
jgi:hypothetical protein